MIRRILTALMIAAAPSMSHAADETAALQVATELVEGAHGAMTSPTLGQEARDDALRTVIAGAFAFDIWERFLLKGREDALSDPERAEFRALLPGFLAKLYSDKFGQGLEAKPEIEGARPVRKDVMVSATIPRSNGKNLPVEWRVREFAEAHKVIDVMVGGISFLVLKREEFGAVLDRDGASGLLAFMREESL